MLTLLKEHPFRRPLWIALSVLLLVVSVVLLSILYFNSGVLTFTLDDAYIHLALADHIIHGHYGINANEFASPSSSILWPFLLAPFADLPFGEYAVLVLNVAAAMGTMILFWMILAPEHVDRSDERSQLQKSLILGFALLLAIPATNLVGLIFIGMEHSAQLFLSILIVYGLICEIRDGRISWWLLTAIVVAPLIRYECLSLSGPALLFLFARGYRKASISIGAVLLLLLGGFSAFLKSLGLLVLPTSILVKSPIASTGGSVGAVLENLHNSLGCGEGIRLVVVLLALLFSALSRRKDASAKLLAVTISLSVWLHLLGGKYNWYHRYEVYIWGSALMTLIYLNKSWLYELPSQLGLARAMVFMALCGGLLSASYAVALVETPIAANNIYEQQYQMHRFALEYNKPIAVNDIGLVSYDNPNYVLDLWGLASIRALKSRLSNSDPSWMGELVHDKKVKLVMIYDGWFRDRIPTSWKKLGVLSLGKMRITPAWSKVSFYAVDCDAYANIVDVLKPFSASLPRDVGFSYTTNECAQKKNIADSEDREQPDRAS